MKDSPNIPCNFLPLYDEFDATYQIWNRLKSDLSRYRKACSLSTSFSLTQLFISNKPRHTGAGRYPDYRIMPTKWDITSVLSAVRSL